MNKLIPNIIEIMKMILQKLRILSDFIHIFLYLFIRLVTKKNYIRSLKLKIYIYISVYEKI